MVKFFSALLFVLSLGLGLPAAFAQDQAPAEEDDGSSERTEQRDDAYRRQMELEDARASERTYVDNTYDQKAELEKIDKLPEESRDNIRDQLVDVIVQNGEWEPKDALEELPYTPTAAAQADSELMQQEQEAWDEQVEKYHAREAAAFGTNRGPVPGPGNPSGQEGGQQGQSGDQGGGQGGQAGDGEGQSGDGSAGTYQPYQAGANGSEDEVSTAGVSESALDFLKRGQARQQPAAQGDQTQAQTQAQAQAQAQAQEAMEQVADAQAEPSQQSPEQAQADQSAEQAAEQAQQDPQQESPADIQVDTRGIIAIRDLDKLEGAGVRPSPEEPDDP